MSTENSSVIVQLLMCKVAINPGISCDAGDSVVAGESRLIRFAGSLVSSWLPSDWHAFRFSLYLEQTLQFNATVV